MTNEVRISTILAIFQTVSRLSGAYKICTGVEVLTRWICCCREIYS